jgi:hypothetical protein
VTLLGTIVANNTIGNRFGAISFGYNLASDDSAHRR